MICFGAPSAAGSAFPLPAAHPCCDVSSKLRLQQARPLVDEAEDVSRLVTEPRTRGCHSAVLGMIGHAAANSQDLFSPASCSASGLCRDLASGLCSSEAPGLRWQVVSAAIWFTLESLRLMNMKGHDAGIEFLKRVRRGDVSSEAREAENMEDIQSFRRRRAKMWCFFPLRFKTWTR